MHKRLTKLMAVAMVGLLSVSLSAGSATAGERNVVYSIPSQFTPSSPPATLGSNSKPRSRVGTPTCLTPTETSTSR